MSYNSYTVTTNSTIQPYINSSIEYGYFYFNNLGYAAYANKWYSAISSLITNNGIATIDNPYYLKIINPGTYKLTVSLNVIATNGSNSPNTTSFAFGTTYLFDQDLTGCFGGNSTSGMFTNPSSYPYIVSWNTNAYSSNNNTPSEYSRSNNYLVYNFYGHSTATSNGSSQYTQSPGICSTEIIFTVNQSQEIFLNVLCNQSNLVIANSFFTLELLTTKIF